MVFIVYSLIKVGPSLMSHGLPNTQNGPTKIITLPTPLSALPLIPSSTFSWGYSLLRELALGQWRLGGEG